MSPLMAIPVYLIFTPETRQHVTRLAVFGADCVVDR